MCRSRSPSLGDARAGDPAQHDAWRSADTARVNTTDQQQRRRALVAIFVGLALAVAFLVYLAFTNAGLVRALALIVAAMITFGVGVLVVGLVSGSGIGRTCRCRSLTRPGVTVHVVSEGDAY